MPMLLGCLVKRKEMFKVQLAVLWTFHDKIKVTDKAYGNIMCNTGLCVNNKEKMSKKY